MAKHLQKAPLVQTLRELLRDLFVLREQGGAHARYTQALGHVDGYMHALIQAGLAEERELLQVVREEREQANGPGKGELSVEADTRAVA
jgi:hypothetical protein